MQSLWNNKEATKIKDNPLALRVYSSRLLGQDPNLVLHGGGNTSVKTSITNLFGETEEVLYVKGSGWDLATIEEAGFAPVRLEVLKRLATLPQLTDNEMVRAQRSAMLNPEAPNPSVEAILHAIIPFAYVDHTHADAVVAISNTPSGRERIAQIYGDSVLIVPYVMPGFILARKIFEMTQNTDWSKLKGMILMNHGVFTFADDAQTSYENMIKLVTQAEDYLAQKINFQIPVETEIHPVPLTDLAALRKAVSTERGKPMLAVLNNGDTASFFAKQKDLKHISQQAPLTPDHVIRTKRIPLLVEKNHQSALQKFKKAYQDYFDTHKTPELTCLDTAPRWAVWQPYGSVSFGDNLKTAHIIQDITEHTMQAILQAEALEKWQGLPASDIFEVEYWELEQAKLKKAKANKPFAGKIALVTGAASGIGKACVMELHQQGAVVAALDINPAIESLFPQKEIIGIACDVTDNEQVMEAVETCVSLFGGLDMLVSNAGIFPKSHSIEAMDEQIWEQSMQLNLSAHQRLLQIALPYLKEGIDPAVLMVGSKNVAAPGKGASAYSVAKAGLTQLARIAAMELAQFGIRVNTVHPNAVFDTGIWTEEVLKTRATHYNLSVNQYKKNNLLQSEITSEDVATLVVTMLGDVFSKITGAQVPIDGGNDRVI